jgi:hypothetical protein
MPRRLGKIECRSQRLAAGRSCQILCHLDFAVCHRTGYCQVLDLYDDPPHRLDTEVPEDSRMVSFGSDVGLVPHHFLRNSVLLPASPRFV